MVGQSFTADWYSTIFACFRLRFADYKVSLFELKRLPWVKIELMEEFLTPRPTCEVVGLGSPFAVVVAV